MPLTLKIGGKVRYRPDGTPLPMIAVPVFGYKRHISIDRRLSFIRQAAHEMFARKAERGGDFGIPSRWANAAPRHRSAEHRQQVWADSAYRSQSNEAWVDDRMPASRIYRRGPKGKSMPIATARANAAKSSIRARIEQMFAHQKNRFGLFIRTIDIARAEPSQPSPI